MVKIAVMIGMICPGKRETNLDVEYHTNRTTVVFVYQRSSVGGVVSWFLEV